MLYVSFSEVRDFASDDRVRLERIAVGAGHAIRNGRVWFRAIRARKTIEELAEVSVVTTGMDQFLKDLGVKMQTLTDATSIVLMEYNQAADRFRYPYVMQGVGQVDWTGKQEGFPKRSWCREWMNRDLSESTIFVERSR